MTEDLTDFQVLVRTGKLHFLDAVDLALTEAGIPHYLQEENVSGLIEAMPAGPSPGPGNLVEYPRVRPGRCPGVRCDRETPLCLQRQSRGLGLCFVRPGQKARRDFPLNRGCVDRGRSAAGTLSYSERLTPNVK